MAIVINTNVKPLIKKPLDDRQHVNTLAQLRALTLVNNGFETYCEATDKWYKFHSDNTEDPETGKWRERASGGSGGDNFSNRFHFCDTLPRTDSGTALIRVRKSDGILQFAQRIHDTGLLEEVKYEACPSDVSNSYSGTSNIEKTIYYVDLDNNQVDIVAKHNDDTLEWKAQGEIYTVEEINNRSNVTYGFIIDDSTPAQEKHFYITSRYYNTYAYDTKFYSYLAVSYTIVSSLDTLLLQTPQGGISEGGGGSSSGGVAVVPGVLIPKDPTEGAGGVPGSGQVVVPVDPSSDDEQIDLNESEHYHFVLVPNEEADYGYDAYMAIVNLETKETLYRKLSRNKVILCEEYDQEYFTPVSDPNSQVAISEAGLPEQLILINVAHTHEVSLDNYEEYIVLNGKYELIGRDNRTDYNRLEHDINQLWKDVSNIDPDRVVSAHYAQFSFDVLPINTRNNNHILQVQLENIYSSDPDSDNFWKLWEDRRILGAAFGEHYGGFTLSEFRHITVPSFAFYDSDTPSTRNFCYIGSNGVFGGDETGWTLFWEENGDSRNYGKIYVAYDDDIDDHTELPSLQFSYIKNNSLSYFATVPIFKLFERVEQLEAKIAVLEQANNS